MFGAIRTAGKYSLQGVHKTPVNESHCRPISLETSLSMVNFNDFRLAAIQDGMYDLSALVLELRVSLLDENGSEPAINAEVAPRCGILHNLISQLQVIPLRFPIETASNFVSFLCRSPSTTFP